LAIAEPFELGPISLCQAVRRLTRKVSWSDRMTLICRLEEAGAGLQDVIRTRMFVTDISRWEEIAKAHKEAFAEITPATSMVEVSRLIGDGMLVEIEADAIVSDD